MTLAVLILVLFDGESQEELGNWTISQASLKEQWKLWLKSETQKNVFSACHLRILSFSVLWHYGPLNFDVFF